jgi:hypothetical protein
MSNGKRNIKWNNKNGKGDFNTSNIKDSNISVNKICYITTSDDLDIIIYLGHGMQFVDNNNTINISVFIDLLFLN